MLYFKGISIFGGYMNIESIAAWLIIAYELLWKTFLQKYVEAFVNKSQTRSITNIQEDVKSNYQRDLQLFTKDLTFKYDFFLDQYKTVYSPLYKLICESEAERYFTNLNLVDNNEHLKFSNVPFVFQDNDVNEKISYMTNLIETNPSLSEPQLLKTVILYKRLTQEDYGNKEELDKKLCILRQKIIKSILVYHRLLESNLRINPEHSDGDKNVLDEELIVEDRFYERIVQKTDTTTKNET